MVKQFTLRSHAGNLVLRDDLLLTVCTLHFSRVLPPLMLSASLVIAKFTQHGMISVTSNGFERKGPTTASSKSHLQRHQYLVFCR